MPNFQDSFRRDKGADSNLQYDDTAFCFFLLSLLITVSIPLLFSVLRPIICGRRPVKNCPCAPCGAKLQRICRATRFSFVSFSYALKVSRLHFNFQIAILIVLAISIFNLYAVVKHTEQIKGFDPYEILGISRDTPPPLIRKAYRKLIVLFHPDKNLDPSATSKFILITKAYECLTDEKKKEICEKYGNPDGQVSFQVALAMPSVLLKKQNSVLILAVFFLLLLVLLPSAVFYWYSQSNLYDDYGVHVSNQMMYYQTLNENVLPINLAEYLCYTKEVLSISFNRQQRDDLSALLQ